MVLACMEVWPLIYFNSYFKQVIFAFTLGTTFQLTWHCYASAKLLAFLHVTGAGKLYIKKFQEVTMQYCSLTDNNCIFDFERERQICHVNMYGMRVTKRFKSFRPLCSFFNSSHMQSAAYFLIWSLSPVF